jgi:hypothetical protein
MTVIEVLSAEKTFADGTRALLPVALSTPWGRGIARSGNLFPEKRH